MGLLTVAIYIVLWTAFRYFIAPLWGISGISFVWMSLALWVVSFIFVLLGAFLIHSYQPEWKPILRRLLDPTGTRWLAFSTLGVAIGLTLLVLTGHLRPPVLAVTLPVGLVAWLHGTLGDIAPPWVARPEPTLPSVVIPEPPAPEALEDIVREFRWEWQGRPYSLKLVIRKSLYEDFRNRPRVPYNRWAQEYVARGICGEIRALAHQLMEIGQPYGTYQEVSWVLAFVQQAIRYEREATEYPKYPVETLVDGTGDCEDFSILGASILKTMGYDVALLFLPGHCALGVAGAPDIPGVYAEYGGRRYYYCEMTAQGWSIGELPSEFRPEQIQVHPVLGLEVESP
jgi:hypothetical protein